MDKINSITGKAVFVPGSDIDTDRIIPARFMKCVTFNGLGEYLFYDVRYDKEGNKISYPLNDSKFSDASILISGINFGCGSSREHAPQAIYRYGFRAIIAQSFADIFFGNSIAIGLPCLVASKSDIDKIVAYVSEHNLENLTIDIQNKVVLFGDDNKQSIPVSISDSAYNALTTGEWDPIEQLNNNDLKVTKTLKELDYI